MAKTALPAIWTEVIIVKLFAGLFAGLWPLDLPPDVMREMAVEPILAVACEIVDARIVAPFNMLLLAFLVVVTLFHCKILLGAELLNPAKLTSQFLVLDEVSVEHQQ